MPTPIEIAEFARSFGAQAPAAASAQGNTVNVPPPATATASTNAPSEQEVADFAASLPQSANAFGAINAPPGSVIASPYLSNMQERYGRTDAQGQPVPLDTQGGFIGEVPLGGEDTGFAPLLKYWKISQQSDPEAKADYLQKQYPNSKVQVLDTGDVTLEVPDSAHPGKTKDVVINPRGMDAEDFIDLTAHAPELGAEAATWYATKGKGFMRTLGQMALSAIAGGFTGAARDAATRKITGIPVRPGDIATERGAETALDFFGQGAMGTLGKATGLLSPFSKPAPPDSLAFNMREGVDFLNRNLGLNYEQTPGMRTGSPALLAGEAAESPMPGARNVMDALRARANKTVQESQRLALGNISTDEQIANDAFGQLKDRVVAPLEAAFQQARQTAIANGDKRVQNLIDNAIGGSVSIRVTPTEAGNVSRSAYQRKLITADAAVKRDYAAVEALPGGTGDVLDGTPAASAATAIRDELPAVVKDVEKETGLVDLYGNPETFTEEERQLLKSGVPEGLLNALKDLESLRGGKVSLQTLTNMKKAAYDAIAAFKTAHGDVKDRWFTRIAGAYEQGIQEGIDATGDPALKAALTKARNTYKSQMVPLERPGLRELAKTMEDPGYLSGAEVANRIFTGDKALHNYNLLEETLGANNVAMRALKRAWVDTRIADAYDPVLKTYDADKLAAVFKSFNTQSPELAEKIFGKNFEPLQEALIIRSAMQRAGVKSIDEGELRTLLNLKDPTVGDLQNVLAVGKLRDAAYVNSVFKDIADGVALNNFNSATFVSKLRNTDIPITQVKAALSKLDRNTRDQIATAELYRVLSEGSVSQGETAVRAFRGEPVNLSPSKLVAALGDTQAERARTELLLGSDLPMPTSGAAPPVISGSPPLVGAKAPNRADYLLALVKTLAPKEAASTVFSGLGSVSSASAVRQLTTGPLKYATGFTKNMLLASAYVKGLGSLLTNTAIDGETSALIANTLIASEPTLRLMAETFDSDSTIGKITKAVVTDAKQSIDRFVRDLNNSPAGRKRVAARQFMAGQRPTAGGIQVPMRMQTGPALPAQPQQPQPQQTLQQLQDRMLQQAGQQRLRRPPPEPALTVPAPQP